MFTTRHKQLSALAGPVNHLLFVLSTYYAGAGNSEGCVTVFSQTLQKTPDPISPTFGYSLIITWMLCLVFLK